MAIATPSPVRWTDPIDAEPPDRTWSGGSLVPTELDAVRPANRVIDVSETAAGLAPLLWPCWEVRPVPENLLENQLPRTGVFIDIQPAERLGDLARLNSYAAGVESLSLAIGRGVAIVFDDSPAMNPITVGAFHRGKRQGTWETGYTITDLELLHGGLTVDRLAAVLPAQMRERYRQALQSRGSLTDAGAKAILAAIVNEQPDLRQSLVRLARYPGIDMRYSPERQTMLALERESLGLSFDLAGLPRDTRLNWEPVEEDAPFITGYANEAGMTNHDMEWFDGIRSDAHPAEVHARVFRHPRVGKLVVANYDKTSAETELGLDLVYYHLNRRSYVCIQYKRMTKTETGWVYYETDQMEKQLVSMRNTPVETDNAAVAGYRLNPDPFYFKLAKVSGFDPGQRELLPGMYLPRTLVDLLRGDPAFVTSGGRLRVGWDDNGKIQPPYLTNTDFTALFREGLIGSAGTTTSNITDVIRQSLDRGNRAMLAVRDSHG